METPPLRTFLFLITFLAVFGLIVGTIPYEFIVASEEYTEPEIEGYFEAMDLMAYAETWTYCMNETGGKLIMGYLYVVELDIGGHDSEYHYTKANYSSPYIVIRHFYTVWWFFLDACYMDWYNDNGLFLTTKIGVTKRLMLAELEDNYEDAQPFTVKCKHFAVDVFYAYNETTYSNVEDAWNHHGLYVLIGITIDDLATGLNAWNIVGMVLLVDMPNIHPIFNYMIAIPIWVAIIWLAFAFIIAVIKSLPFT